MERKYNMNLSYFNKEILRDLKRDFMKLHAKNNISLDQLIINNELFFVFSFSVTSALILLCLVSLFSIFFKYYRCAAEIFRNMYALYYIYFFMYFIDFFRW
ncbi:hypothetical protein EDEG_00394 [Edhazardia aedis USNM 41457]|uniref:Uncharacterized protein n=1 Tax=Edhazardia aedis (strain USNM 41457) TaxID=1003232 RepID=J9DJZ7_EDHAE|nr:hypothetical protein EDEG_00394 [Edhazardia aedis USNM 41457]|eukprot:EJW01677.1 hypothetical protein EDEG_00394 [Edhazardia aedis USNM 41457]